jgi:branched-chain amino acid transport system ATP-binding protein
MLGAPSDALLRVSALEKSFGGIHAVREVTFDLPAGGITAVIGPNGAGKSSLFNLLTGFERADGGRVEFLGRDISQAAPHAISRLGLVRTFQLTRVFSALDVMDNMLLARVDDPGDGLFGAVFRPRTWRANERAARRRAGELLEMLGLDGKARDPAGALSGGQRKLLELGRALMLEPKLLLLDEPLAGVNPTLGKRLMGHIEQLARDEDVTILFVEHDLDVVMRHSGRVLVMAGGSIVADGSPAEVRSDRRVLDAYLGGAPAKTGTRVG